MMNRRKLLELLTTAGLVTAGATVATESSGSSDHDMQNMPGMQGMHDHSGMKSKYPDLIQSTSKCVNSAEACLAHCVAELTSGNLEMKNCAITSQDVITACTALRQMAARNAPRVAEMAAVCGRICRDCEAECKKQEAHKVCRECRESCAQCAKACESLAA
jgi:Cys-rich four helix bundle protein (predicted Tat secretion target)